ncbi:hypothetical protein PI124_g2525 [Phytophthora idaei]|nr:hypothetical protein PI125_g25350 [Phytophthora idaei]KAG3164035.1 hypothetical protein PI126_g5288 [Phytophthora idaei]KAG3252846.1 hypothetical protein PI124_g2525 [Phytophthora idaei]
MEIERNLLDELLMSSDWEGGDAVDMPAQTHPHSEDSVIEFGVPSQNNSENCHDDVNARGGVVDFTICGDALDGRIWVCGFPVQLDVADAEVLVIGHVLTLLKRFVCDKVTTGIVLEGSQCSHTADYDCLRWYNARYLGKTRNMDLLCLVCKYPFPCHLVDSDDEEKEEETGCNDDNSFEYEGPLEIDEGGAGGNDDSNSVDVYHPSDFNSEADNSDAIYDHSED